MFSPLAFTKTYAMAAAAALTITLVPVLMGYFIRGKIRAEQHNPLNRQLLRLYTPVLQRALDFPKTTLALAALLLLSALWPLYKTGSEFIPPLDEGDLMYMPSTYPGLSIGKAREILQQTDKLIATVPEVKSVFGKIGRAETATDPAPLTMIETFIQLKPKNQWRKGVTTESLKKELDALVTLPGISNTWVAPIKTRIDMLATGMKTPLGIKVAGPELQQIQDIGQALEQLLTPLDGAASVYSERVAAGRYIHIDIDRLQAARFGLNIADVQETIATAIGGRNVSESIEGIERYPINLRYPQSYRDSPERLSLLPIVTPRGEHIALGDVATVSIADGPAGIKSENARRVGWTYIDLGDTDIPRFMQQAQQRIDEHLQLPPGYSLAWSGQYMYMERAKAKLVYVIPMTLGIIVILLYLSFRRFTDVAIIMGTLPLALVGSLWLLYLLDYKFSVATAVGLIALAGVAVEIGVIMTLYLNQALEESLVKVSGTQTLSTAERQHAVLNGAVKRIRPVMMTTVATIAGLLPILISSGTGAEMMQRLAAPMVGGMLSALILTLVVLPTVYFLIHTPHRFTQQHD